MPSIINALTAAGGGVAISGDATGNLTIQSAGTNVATFTTGSNLQLNQSGGKILNSSGNPIVQSTGSVLQVINATDLTERSTTSTSFVTASNTLSVTITPTSTSSKIFIVVTTTGYKNDNNNAVYTIYRDATNLGNSTNGMQVIPFGNYYPIAMSILDSPNTTSATTYQVYFRMTGGTGNAYLTAGLAGAGNFSSMTVFEIAS